MRLVEPGHFSANVSRARRRCCARACPSQPRSHSKPSRLSFSVMALAAALGARIEAGYVRKVLGTAGTPLHLDEIEAAHERRDDVRPYLQADRLRIGAPEVEIGEWHGCAGPIPRATTASPPTTR